MLVDDELGIRLTLAAILEGAGYLVDVAEGGADALDKLQDCLPNLIITDLRMPDMNGPELLARVRANFDRIPAILISGEALTGVSRDGLVANADAFVLKDESLPPVLLAIVAHLLAHDRAERSPGRQTRAVGSGTA